MKNVIQNILAIFVGLGIGMGTNMGIILLSGILIPLPEGVDPNDIESIKSNMHLYEPKHFLMPFLAHAFGTLTGAFATVKIASSDQLRLAIAMGVVFLTGGLTMVLSLPSPLWFNILDLALAYIPMAWIAFKLGNRKQ